MLPPTDLRAQVRGEYQSSKLVVLAEVVGALDLHQVGPEWLGPRFEQLVLWRTVRPWKGTTGVGYQFVTRTITECCVCGAYVRVGERKLLYLGRNEPAPGSFSVSVCSLGELEDVYRQLSILDLLYSQRIASAPNHALQRMGIHKLQARGLPVSLRTRPAACADTGRRAAAELKR